MRKIGKMNPIHIQVNDVADMAYPKTTAKRRQELESIRKQLAK